MSVFVNSYIQILLVLTVTGSSWSTHCECGFPLEPGSKQEAGCPLSTKVDEPICRNWSFTSNITNNTLGNIALQAHSISQNNNSIGMNITFSGIEWNYLRTQYKGRYNNEVKCHVFNFTSFPCNEIIYDSPWTETQPGKEMDLKYQALNMGSGLTHEGHYLFKIPNSSRIDHTLTLVEDWELFLYIDISDLSDIHVKWQAAPSHFHVQYYLLNIFHELENASFHIIESHRIPSSPSNKEESFNFETDSFSGRFYFSVQIIHDNCTNDDCFVSESPIFSLDSETKSPLVIGIVGTLILLPAFIYVFYSWRRFGVIPSHKAPVVLIIYKRTMDSHFKAIVALVMYLRSVCHIRAIIEDFDILSSNVQDSTLWYKEAFTRVDAVMVVSSPYLGEGDTQKAYYNIDSAVMHILAEKSTDKTCLLKFFSVIFPYCTEKDIPVEAKNLPSFTLPKDLNDMLWFIHYGPRSSCFSKLEFFLFQSQIAGGYCDLQGDGKFLKDAFHNAKEELIRLRIMSAARRV